MTKRLPVYLFRYQTSDQGTRGVLLLPDGRGWHTIELPWRDNRTAKSCIPAGEYAARFEATKRHGKTYRLYGVPGRDSILIHSGNVAGDTTKGFLTHSAGCILVGGRTGKLHGQDAILASKPALAEFLEATDGREISLRIIEEA